MVSGSSRSLSQNHGSSATVPWISRVWGRMGAVGGLRGWAWFTCGTVQARSPVPVKRVSPASTRVASAAMPIYALGDHEPVIHPDAYVSAEAVLIGRVHIGPGASVWSGAVLRADDNDIFIGAGTSVQDGAILHVTAVHKTTVGEECTIGHLAHLEGCTIEDRALVGTGSIVLHAAVVESMALVGAGAVVPGGMRVPSRAMALGIPAKIRENVVTDDLILPGVESYKLRAKQFTRELRRVG
jgi:carbonic anhydrase/acetyltransferase-like protein (isoleucine patch superfamily)